MHEPPLVLQVVELIQRRRSRRRAAQRSYAALALHGGAYLLAALSLVLVLLALAALPVYDYIVQELPNPAGLQTMLDPQAGLLLQPTRLLDRSGEHSLLVLSPDGKARQFIQVADAPALARALVASRDPGFWQHSGAQWLQAGVEPHTLAEHLAAEVLLAGEPEGWRKALRARVLAADITVRYGREQVLTWALNSARFGHWTFGAQSAARFYFDKPARELSLVQAAALAAMAGAPTVDALQTPATAELLGRLVLVAMHNQRMITDGELATALLEPLQFAPAAPLPVGSFERLALQQAEAALGRTRLERGGLRLITTQDVALQAEVNAAAAGQASLVLDALNGRVLALAGDAATSRPAGELLLPFLYLDAFASGDAPATLAWNLDSAAAPGTLGPLSMRRALANGLRQPAQGILEQLGPHHVANVLAGAGFDAFQGAPDPAQSAAWALGEAMVTPLELGAAYASLGDGLLSGQWVEGRLQPAALLFATDELGRIVLNWSVAQHSALASAELAFLVTDSLSDVSARTSEARQALIALGRPAALAPGGGSGWQLAYTPQRVVLSFGAVDAWPELFAAAHASVPIRDWRAPGGLTSVMVCVPSGQLPGGDCPETRREYFLSGSEPRFADTLFVRLAVNSLNGRLATVFTPVEFVQEQLFVRPPAAQRSAALAAGLPLAAEEYDSIPALQPAGAISIIAPARFDSLEGVVAIRGQIGPQASGWNIQVGQGLYPVRWLQVAAGSAGEAVEARWDTADLSGLWAIQLQVWDEDGGVERAYAVISIESEND